MKKWKLIFIAGVIIFVVGGMLALYPRNEKFGYYTVSENTLFFEGKTYHHIASLDSSTNNIGKKVGIAIDENDKNNILAHFNGTGMFYVKWTLYQSSKNPRILYSYYNAVMENIYDEWEAE